MYIRCHNSFVISSVLLGTQLSIGATLQVIEKALKKLKLDAMIIQQGRLSDNKASVNKDDLLSMVRYGAEMVFSGGGGTITDEDIDAIIAKVCFQHLVMVHDQQRRDI